MEKIKPAEHSGGLKKNCRANPKKNPDRVDNLLTEASGRLNHGLAGAVFVDRGVTGAGSSFGLQPTSTNVPTNARTT